MFGREENQMLNKVMAVVGFFLMCADSIPVAAIGIGLMVVAAHREGAFYGMKPKRKESCHRPK